MLTLAGGLTGGGSYAFLDGGRGRRRVHRSLGRPAPQVRQFSRHSKIHRFASDTPGEADFAIDMASLIAGTTLPTPQ